MQCTSAEASKLLKKMMEEETRIVKDENQRISFVAATVENPDDVRPEYDFGLTQVKIQEIELKIRKIRHAINVFNTTTMVPECGMTIDQVLVILPQLNAMKNKLDSMRKMLPKSRKKPSYGEKSNFIEYEYANFDIAEAEEEYTVVADNLMKIQLALDKINTTEKFNIDV